MKIKQILYNCIVLIFCLCLTCTAAVVSENDGAAFITKAEFDTLKNRFQQNIDAFNKEIEVKVDNIISDYLAGVHVETVVDLESLLNKCNVQTKNKRDNKFISASTIVIPETQKPTASKYSFLGFYTHGLWPIGGRKNNYDLIRWGNTPSVNNGRTWEGVNDTKNCFYGLALTNVSDTNSSLLYWHFEDTNVYKVTYSSYIVGNDHRWNANELYPSVPTSFVAGTPPTSTLRWGSNKGDIYDWAAMRKEVSVPHKFDTWGGNTNGTANQTVQWSQYYQKTLMTDRNTNFIGYCYSNLSDTNKIYFLDKTKWYMAIDTGTTNKATNMYGHLTYRHDNETGNGSNLSSSTSTMTWYEYFHDIKQLNVNELANYTATTVLGETNNYVKLFEGLPLCKATANGKLSIKIKGECFDANNNSYNGSWTGKLYIKEGNRFSNSATTTSDYYNISGARVTNGITVSNSINEISIDIKCSKDKIYWIKYILDTTTSGLKVQFTSSELQQSSVE